MNTIELNSASLNVPRCVDDSRLFEDQAGVAAMTRTTSRDAKGVPTCLIEDPILKTEVESSTRRLDPISGKWTIFATSRSRRPMEFTPAQSRPNRMLECPFCAGNESMTPASVWRAVDDDSSWQVRVVPNKFPAVSQSNQTSNHSTGEAGSQSNLFQSQTIGGGHEVVIESPRHFRSVTELNLSQFVHVMMAYRERIRHWSDVDGIGNISVFKNVGAEAGASLSHGHSQIVATDYVPDAIGLASRNQAKHRARTGSCLQCDLVRQEVRDVSRLLFITGEMIAFCPYASPHAGMIRITSRRHHGCLTHLSNNELSSAAEMLWQSVRRMEKTFGEVAYNYVLNIAPTGMPDPSDSFHWSIDLIPRRTKVAGFEWNTGMMINGTLPEAAASAYRAA